MSRNTTIYKLRDQQKTLKSISLKTGITSERVRQILLERDMEHCDRHKSVYIGFCELCKEEKSYKTKLSTMDLSDIIDLAKSFRKDNRKKANHLKRILIAKELRNRLGLKYVSIGKILNRDHACVIKMCNKP